MCRSIIDAGIGAPSHAALAMEMGYDAVLLNTAVAKAVDPVRMADAFAKAIEAGRLGLEAGLMEARDMAGPSTPVAGTPFFDLGPKFPGSVRSVGLARFYPIVPDADWLGRLVPLGVRTVQLRIKDAAAPAVRRQIAASAGGHPRVRLPAHRQRLLARGHRSAAPTLFISARTICDVPTFAAIKRARMRLGISTHSEAELERALARNPTMWRSAPIYETKLKAMPWAPQGLERVAEWRARIGTLPLVAIGGITPAAGAGRACCGSRQLGGDHRLFDRCRSRGARRELAGSAQTASN